MTDKGRQEDNYSLEETSFGAEGERIIGQLSGERGFLREQLFTEI